MSWTILTFGKHEGKTLPQVIFSDPDWFFWAIDKEIFKGSLASEARELDRKARNIKLPQKNKKERMVAEYAIHPSTRSFGHMELVPESRPHHVGSTPTFRKDVIDLSTPREMANYDKLVCSILIHSVKYYLFGNRSARMTRKRCEEFFENDENFA